MAKIFQLLKDSALISTEGRTDEELTEIEKKFDELEATYAKTQAKPLQVVKPAGTEQTAPDPRIDALADSVEKLAGTVETLAKNQQTLVNDVKTREQRAQEAATAASKKRYEEAVNKAADEGRLTKAELEEELKPEKMDRRIGNEDVMNEYLDGLGKRAVQPGFKPPVQTGKSAPEPKTQKEDDPAKEEDPALREAKLYDSAADALDAFNEAQAAGA